MNEAAPGPGEHFELTAAAAQLADRDGNLHLVSTSTGAGLATHAWKLAASAPIHYADFHCYVRPTGWIEPKDALANDSACFFHEYDLAAQAADFGKPVVCGEMGIDGPGAGSDDEEPRLARDTAGTWLHKILWARCGPGGVYPLYWWTDNLFRNRLHHLFGNWHRFMEGIPLSNGRYTNAAATSSNPRIRLFGQKDTVAGPVHLWLDNADHTWRAVVEGRTWSAHTATISVAMAAANARYQLAWVDTSTRRTVSHETRVADAAGVLAFSVTNLMTDIAVKIERVLTPRERRRWQHFGTPENRGAAADSADPDGDGVPNLLEYALAGNPAVKDAEFLRLTPELLSAGPPQCLSISHRQGKAATDLRYKPQAGRFLFAGDWSSNGVVELQREDAGAWWRVTARDSLPLEHVRQRFMRLTIREL